MIYENVKELCDKKNISIRSLETKAGIGNGTIGRWKKSKPNLETLQKVADELGVTTSRLIR